MGDFSVQISADLVNRFANDGKKPKKKTKKTKTKILQEPAQPQTKLNEKKFHDDSETHKVAVTPGWRFPPPLHLPVTPPVESINGELDAIRSVIRESERVLEKLQKHEDSMVQEVTERAKDLRDKEFKLPYQKPIPCLAEYEACQMCYKECSNDVLKCASLTKNYYDCVRRAKQQVSSTDK